MNAVIDVVAPAVIVLGFIRGTFLGQIKSADALFGTAYGVSPIVAGALLEEKLGVPLFHRVRKRLVPSDAGRLFAIDAAALLARLDSVAFADSESR